MTVAKNKIRLFFLIFASALFIKSVIISAAATTVESSDKCQAYKTCASCAGARYHPHPDFDSSFLPGAVSDKSLSSSSFSATSSSRHQRKGGDTLNFKVDDFNDDESAETETIIEKGWFHRRPTCAWCPVDGTCSSTKHHEQTCGGPAHVERIHYEYDCPLGPTPYPPHPPQLLPDWMGTFVRAIPTFGALTLLDITLPGTHDSISYDLSLTVSDDGNDAVKRLSYMLHALSGGTIQILPGELEEFFRLQAKTQQLSITEQLDNGIRFIDFRIMMEDDDQQWYSMHFMQSNHPAEYYLQQIRDWVDAHPEEIIMIWLSKHGSTTATGEQQYPHVSPEQKQSMWERYMSIFDGLLLDTRVSAINTTSIATLLSRNHRVVTFVSDYVQFTNSTYWALDASLIDNYYYGDGVFDEITTIEKQRLYFANATMNNHMAKAKSGLTLLSMNSASPSWQVKYAAENRFLPHWLEGTQIKSKLTLSDISERNKKLQEQDDDDDDNEEEEEFKEKESWTLSTLSSFGKHRSSVCASKMNIPGIQKWCPETLLDIAQLASYYNQISFEESFLSATGSSVGSATTTHLEKNAQMQSLSDSTTSTTTTSSDNTNMAFPNAFYIDALDYNGTVRTGTQLLFGAERAGIDAPNKDTKYAYVDTILAYNLHVACAGVDRRTGNMGKQTLPLTNPVYNVDDASSSLWQCKNDNDNVDELMKLIQDRRARYPMKLWDEPEYGRHDDWPSSPNKVLK